MANKILKTLSKQKQFPVSTFFPVREMPSISSSNFHFNKNHRKGKFGKLYRATRDNCLFEDDGDEE